jgi:glycosyltransferase involved in cell wall biosynthesis
MQIFDNKYKNQDHVTMIRLSTQKNKPYTYKFKRFENLYPTIEEISPDVLFIHGCQFIDIKIIVKYLKAHPNIVTYVDNHADFSNSASNWLSKNILHKLIWRHYAKMIDRYIKKFYGVLPARVDFLIDVYKLPKEKVELLVMGADDELVEKAKNPEVKRYLRKKYNIAQDDFLIMTGGKIDLAKRQTLLLMQAVQSIPSERVKLIVFGSVVDELKNQVQDLADGKKVQYIGWIDANESYEYFASADLVVFPGRHSVFWEQVVAQGIPMIVKYWQGTTHIDIGGNCQFLYEDSVDEIQHVIESLVDYSEKYQQLWDAAQKSVKNNFLYSEIAKKSLS